MELTDGWYNIRCQIDSEMNKLICKKKVTIGTKLLIMNAELIGANEGCDPLQVIFFSLSIFNNYKVM